MGVTIHGPVSLSKSALLLSPCIAWAGPQALWYDEDKVDHSDTEKRDKGTSFHRDIDRFTGTGIIHLDKTEEENKWRLHATKYLDEVLIPRCDSVQTEVAVGINWVTNEAEVFPDVKDRGYPKRPGWQFGTADLVCILKDGSLLIADWKTGGNDGATEQLLSLAAGFRLCMPVNYGPTGIGPAVLRPVRILCLQVNEYGVWPHEDPVSPEEIEAHWDSMRFQWEDIGKRNDPVPGIHCTTLYCPHLAYCSAISGVVGKASENAPEGEGPLVKATDLVKGSRLGHRMTDKPSSNDEAGFVMARISAAKRQMKYWEKALQEFVTKRGGKVTQGQYEWGPGNNGWRWRKQ